MMEMAFVAEYPKDFNSTRAALRAGVSPKTAEDYAYRVMKRPQVKVAITKAIERFQQSRLITSQSVLDEIHDLAKVNVQDAYDSDGCLKPLGAMEPAVAKCIAAIETQELKGIDGEKIGRVVRVKFWDKTAALNMLAKYLKLWVERTEMTGPDGKPLQVESKSTVTTNINFSEIDTETLKLLAAGA